MMQGTCNKVRCACSPFEEAVQSARRDLHWDLPSDDDAEKGGAPTGSPEPTQPTAKKQKKGATAALCLCSNYIAARA